MATDPAELIYSMLGKAGLGAFTEAYNQGSQWKQDALKQQIITTQLAEAQQKQQQASSFHADVSAWDGKPEGLVALARAHPEQIEQVQNLYKLQDDEQKNSAKTYWGQIVAGAQSGSPQIILAQAQRRLAAEKQANLDTTDTQYLIDQFADGDEPGLAAAQKLGLAHLRAIDPAAYDKAYGTDTSNHFGTTGAGEIFDQRTGEVKSSGHAAPNMQRIEVTNPDGSVTTRFVNISGGGGPASSGRGKADGSFDTFHANFLGPIEGGYADRDGASGAPVNYGVNQKFNPDINVKNLTPEQGKDVLRQRYWKASGADKLPAGLAEIHGDTAVNMGVGTAKRLLAQSRGDPERYLELREARYRSIGGKDLGNWLNRNNRLREYVGLQDGAAVTNGAAPSGLSFETKPAADSDVDPTLTGNAYLETLPAGIRPAVKAIAEGRVAPPRAGTRNGEAMLDRVTRYDPTFDAANAQSRTKTRVDFTSGKSAQAVNALNTAMGHLIHLDQQGARLPNASVLPGFINSGRRWVANNINGTSEYKTFEQTKQAASSEMRKVFAGAGGGSLSELEEWQRTLDSAGSPEQIHAVIANGVTLMGSRLNALQDQYSNGMGRSDTTPQFIKPGIAKIARRRFGVDLSSGHSMVSAAPSTPALRILKVRPK